MSFMMQQLILESIHCCKIKLKVDEIYILVPGITKLKLPWTHSWNPLFWIVKSTLCIIEINEMDPSCINTLNIWDQILGSIRMTYFCSVGEHHQLILCPTWPNLVYILCSSLICSLTHYFTLSLLRKLLVQGFFLWYCWLCTLPWWCTNWSRLHCWTFWGDFVWSQSDWQMCRQSWTMPWRTYATSNSNV